MLHANIFQNGKLATFQMKSFALYSHVVLVSGTGLSLDSCEVIVIVMIWESFTNTLILADQIKRFVDDIQRK